MSGEQVIVFGPTGSVASIAAKTAQEQGAKVALAMRDTSKTIPGLSAEEERQQGFTRVTADLTKPDTVSAAVKEAGAKRAFIYLAHATKDHMKSTIEALKAAGVEFVVFLSSYTIVGEPASVPQHEVIPYSHAQVELQLEHIFPGAYAAVRPGAFATNAKVWWGKGIEQGEVRMFGEKVRFDMVCPEDMGAVAGTILARGPKNGQKLIYVYGPQYLTQEENFNVLKSELDKPVKLTMVDQQTWMQDRRDSGWPDIFAKYLGEKLAEYSADPEKSRFTRLEEGMSNVQLYLGRPGVSFKEWVAKNKTQFA